VRLKTGEGSKSMAVLRGAVKGLFVVILLFGGLVTALLLFR
jgi:hypothetical protein